jgi:hypothetical protein
VLINNLFISVIAFFLLLVFLSTDNPNDIAVAVAALSTGALFVVLELTRGQKSLLGPEWLTATAILIVIFFAPIDRFLISQVASNYRFLNGTQDSVVASAWITLAGLAFFLVTYVMVSGRYRFAQLKSLPHLMPYDNDQVNLSVRLVLLLLILGPIGLFMRFTSFESFMNSGEDRRIVNAGKGYIIIFNYAALLAVPMASFLYFRYRKPLMLVAMGMAVFVGFASFALAGHRGNAFYCILLCIVAYCFARPYSWFSRIPTGTLVFLALTIAVPLNLITRKMRLQFFEGRTTFTAEDASLVTLQFRHFELLAGLKPALDSQPVPSTLLNSLTNFVPRSIYAEKGFGTGASITYAFIPEWVNRSGDHVSAVTTGPIIEGYYNGGILGVFIAFTLTGVVLGLIRRSTVKATTPLAIGVNIVLSLVLAWILWFEELAGVVNYLVALFVTAGVLWLFTFGQNKKPQRFTQTTPRPAPAPALSPSPAPEPSPTPGITKVTAS